MVETPGRSERLAKHHLIRQGFEAYLPMRACEKKVEGSLTPLFPHYLFVRVDLSAPRWSDIRTTIGVRGVLSSGGHPAQAPPKLVSSIREREVFGVVQLNPRGDEKGARFNRGDAVRIQRGKFSGFDAIFDQHQGKRVMVLLSVFGRNSRLLLSADDLKAA